MRVKAIAWFIVLLVLVSVFLSGCDQCSSDEDCSGEELEKCEIPLCKDGICKTEYRENCCGNNKCEKGSEDKCSCPTDCGECKGKAKMISSRGKEYDAKYLEQLCNEEKKCVFSVDATKVRRADLALEREFSHFKLAILASFNNPFIVGEDNVRMTFKLSDDDEDFIPPVMITGVKLTEGQVLFGGRDGLELSFSEVGDINSVEVPITYDSRSAEEERQVSLVVDYQYTYWEGKADEGGETTKRDSFSLKLSEKIFFLSPKGIENG